MKINRIYYPLVKDTHRFLFLIGGAGSGKSYFAAIKCLYRIMENEGERILVTRKVGRTLRNSVFALFKKLISDDKFQNKFIINLTDMRFTYIPTGSEILLAGLDDVEKIKSIAGITSIWMEEASENTFDDFLQLNLRLRGESPSYKQIMLSTNPINEDLWIKKFIDDPVNKADLIVCKSTFLDNAEIDEEYKSEMIKRYSSNELWHMVYVKGEWGRVAKGGEFYSKFKYHLHVRKGLDYDERLPLHLSFDFNVVPYMTIIIYQVDGKRVWQIAEVIGRDPYNSSRDVCQLFKADPRFRNHKAGMFIYGDCNGFKRDTREREVNDYMLIMDELDQYHPQKRVPSENPPVVSRRDFMNAIFEHTFEGIEILIDEDCKETTNDYLNLKQDSDGKKLKQKVKDETSGQPYEKYGHCFIGDTVIQTDKGAIRIDKIKKGDSVLTRKGYRKVLGVHDNGIKDVKTYQAGVYKITCTSNHRIFTHQSGFIEINNIINAMRVLTFCIFAKNKICKERLLFTEVSDLQDIHKVKKEVKGYIIQDGLKVKNLGFMFINGFVRLVRYLLNTISITKTKTRLTTILKTYSVKKALYIYRNTVKILPKNLRDLELKHFYEKQYQPQRFGIVQRRAKNGINNMLKKHSLENASIKDVLNAEINTKQNQLIKQNSVLISAEKEVLQEHLGQRQRVYDLTIEGEHEYFANNILVHNCSDAGDYFFCSCFSSEFNYFNGGDKQSYVSMGKSGYKNNY